MDTLIITHLESLMSRSRVSPYSVARFLSVGLPVAACAAVWHSIRSEDILALIFVALSPFAALVLYSTTSQAERQNARGFINSLKRRNKISRLVDLVGLALNVVLVALGDPIALPWLVFWTFYAAIEYLQALNWTPPPPPKRVWSRDMAGGEA